jgi:hypothetical protein
MKSSARTVAKMGRSMKNFEKFIWGLFFLVFFCGSLAALDLFISLSRGRKRNEPKRKAAGCISEAKNRIISPKTGKRSPLRSVWTCPFLHGQTLRFSSRLSEEAGTLLEFREQGLESRV